MASTERRNIERDDILLLQNILKRKFKGNYGAEKSKIRIDMVTMCAEFNLKYKEVGVYCQQRKAWAIFDANGSRTIVKYCSTKDYLDYIRVNIKGESSTDKHLGARTLKNKVNFALSQMRKILRHINFETGEYSKIPINNKEDIKWILDQKKAPKGKGATKGFGEYFYKKEFDIEPYVDKYFAVKEGVILVKKTYTSNLTLGETKRGHKITNSHEKLIAAINLLQADLFKTISPQLKGLSPIEVQKFLEEHYYSVIRDCSSKYASEFIFDQNVKDSVQIVVDLCNAKPKGWLKKCINILDKVLCDYKNFVSPIVYADLLILNACFIRKYGLSSTFKKHKELPESWINAIGQLYLQAIDISIYNDVNDKRIQYLLEYANFLYDNRQFHLAGEYYRQALALSKEIYCEESISSKKAYADALYSIALYNEEYNELEEAQRCYELALEYRRELANIQEKYRSDVAKTLNNLGNLHKTLYDFDKAEECLTESYQIYKSLSKDDSKLKIHQIIVLRNLALVHGLLGDDYAATKEIKTALDIISLLALNDPEEYNCDKAYLLLDYAALYSKKDNFSETMSKYTQSLSMFREMSEMNPNKHKGRLAWTLNKYVIFHKMDNQYTQTALSYFIEALEIYENLANKSLKVYDSSVGRALNLLADTYFRLEKYDEAYSLQMRAYSIYLKLSEKNPVKYNSNVAWTLNSLAIINWRKGHIEQAVEKNKRAYRIYSQLIPDKSLAYKEAIEWTNSISELLVAKEPYTLLQDCLERSLNIYISDLQRRTRRHLL